jgi:hypothetical protein
MVYGFFGQGFELIVPCLLLVLGGCGNDRPAAARSTTVQSEPSITAGVQVPHEALFYGTSPAGFAWILLVDLARGGGARYRPIRTVTLCGVRRDSAGTVSWSSVPDMGLVERFRGNIENGELTGTIAFGRTGSDVVTKTVDIRLDSLPLSTLSDSTLSGLYSNARYVEPEGDWVGQDILVVATRESTWAAITHYEGTPQGPFPIADLRWTGDSLTGTYRTPDAADLAVVHSKGALRTAQGVVLSRYRTLRDVLSWTSAGTCQ